MSKSKDTTVLGKEGEACAASYFLSKGFVVLERNFRYQRAEIDLIVQKENLMVFAEVKFRKNELFGYPEDFVSEKQKERILLAADHYLHDTQCEKNIRFDIIAINSKMEIEHFEDAFH